jgi:outer membrane protein TolC
VLDTLVSRALRANPAVLAAIAQHRAAAARVGPAGARPDPILTIGIRNFPIAQPGFAQMMTMKTIGVMQTFPFPGKLSLQTTAANDQVTAAYAEVDAARLDAIATVKKTYYELAFTEQALDIIRQHQAVLSNLVTVSETRYMAGQGTQADILRAQTETANLADAANTLTEKRRALLAQLNAVLDRPSGTPLVTPIFPADIVHIAVADSAAHVHFVSNTLGAGASNSPLLPLDSLQTLATTYNPIIRAQRASMMVQHARLDLARKSHLPDISVSLDYGQRQGLTDMVSAMVSIPIPLQKGRKQDATVAAAEAELTAQTAHYHEAVNAVNSEIVQRVSEIEHARTQLVLSKRAILPQTRAILTSSLASYQVGKLDFANVMDAQASVFTAEMAYFQSLTDVAQGIAELEQVVGTGVLR